VGAPRVFGVVAKNGSNTDLIKCLPCAIRVLSCNCSGRAVSGMKTHPLRQTSSIPWSLWRLRRQTRLAWPLWHLGRRRAAEIGLSAADKRQRKTARQDRSYVNRAAIRWVR